MVSENVLAYFFQYDSMGANHLQAMVNLNTSCMAGKTTKHYYYPIIIRSNCLFFAMSRVTELFHRSINLTIDWHYTMAWLPASLLKTHRRLSTYSPTMHAHFIYERRRYATMVKIRHGLATFNSNNSVVYGQKHKVYSFS